MWRPKIIENLLVASAAVGLMLSPAIALDIDSATRPVILKAFVEELLSHSLSDSNFMQQRYDLMNRTVLHKPIDQTLTFLIDANFACERLSEAERRIGNNGDFTHFCQTLIDDVDNIQLLDWERCLEAERGDPRYMFLRVRLTVHPDSNLVSGLSLFPAYCADSN